MSFNGKYELETHENYERFMKQFGLTNADIEKSKTNGLVSEIIQDKNKFKIISKVDNIEHINEFTLGVESTVKTISGQLLKLLVNSDGPNKLIGIMQNIQTVTELRGDKLITTMIDGDLMYKSVSRKVK